MSVFPAELDPRTHAFDPQARLAEVALRGRLPGGEEGWQFVTPHPARAGKARVSLRARPDAGAAQVSEALPGEALEVLYTRGDGWSWVRTAHDGYLGWARAQALVGAEEAGGEELRVTALRAHAFAGPGVSRAVLAELCAGARLTRAPGEVVTEGAGRRWVPVRLPGGEEAWVGEAALRPDVPGDAAAFALRLLEAPYVWGGRSAWGLDCSGLTQLAYAALGRGLPRDADQQQAFLPAVEVPGRGDLAFFPGHVGVMLDGRQMVHANATHLRVTVETLGEGEYGTRLARELSGFGRWRA
ncbi:C40 family peptidase [Deinococcus budaensis]|uniref:Cell wall-associated NlpC family hydrolase n=1 Tax=Deinococcus budaensis TaxID=1665626 RepID=A0A7W8LNW6_9DEIO|nr:NlpC/P60 family protein [Deinococcus budaensis]MBB5232925.1 cell wall-associated NlpC family hydrolase [Deinococcus budaensis]